LAIIHKSGTLPGNETWTADNIYWVDGDLTIPSGITLTINPGTIIKIEYASIFGDGTLTAVGTSEDIIHFTSIKDDSEGGDTNGDGPSAGSIGDWRSIEIEAGGSATFDFATLRYSGYQDHGVLFASGYTIPVVGDHVSLTNNRINGILLPGGMLSYEAHSFPYYPAAAYYLAGDLTIPVGASLTVEPGAIIKINYASIFVNGTLTAVGTFEDIIHFISVKDDSEGGDTNGDGPSAGSIGDWRSIEIGAGGSATFDFATLRYSGYQAKASIYNSGGTVLIENSTLSSNLIGLESNIAAETQIHNSKIMNNNDYGVKNNQFGRWLDAIYNWWGHISGPLDDNPSDGLYNPDGIGNPVNEYVDYTPWLVIPPFVELDFFFLPLVIK